MYVSHALLSAGTELVSAAEPTLLAQQSLPEVIDNLRLWIMGIIAAVATTTQPDITPITG